MFRGALSFITFIAICANPLVCFATVAQAIQKSPYEAANLKYQTQYQESLKKLGDLGVAKALQMRTTLGFINDESASYRLPSLYWVETHGDDKVKLDNERITTIPIAANNILQNVVEKGWDKKIEVSESSAEFKEWQDNKGKTPTHYVVTDIEGNRRFKDVDDLLYYKAQKPTIKQKDSEALHLALADTTPVISPLEDYLKANEELTSLSKKINSVVGRLPGRNPVSTGEHRDEVITESPSNN
ncbi:MAG: hypothetical protein R3A80_12955 [Bdellovibrionota bacterium]